MSVSNKSILIETTLGIPKNWLVKTKIKIKMFLKQKI
jgi:hypothetical protein